ncbi:MAG: hypothetical protein JW969_02575 [Spirochaetales bacterium]|nr:hypothetical protein [Spirochaetales bacterium]
MRQLKPFILFIFLISATSCFLFSPKGVEKFTLPEDPSGNNRKPISPVLYGQNKWSSVPEETWEIVGKSGVKIIRIGGIEYNNNFMSHDLLMLYANIFAKIGAETLIQVSYKCTAQEAAEVVKFFNIDSGRKIRIWSIGNEPDLNNQFNSEQVAEYVLRISSAMKSVDPNILIFIPDNSRFYGNSIIKDLMGGAYDVTGRMPFGPYYIDGLSWHTYPMGRGPWTRERMLTMAPDFRANVEEAVILMAVADKKNGRTGNDRLKWAIGEFNVTWANPYRNDVDGFGCSSFAGGQMWADFYAVGMEMGAIYMTPWSIHESSGTGGSGDLGYLGRSVYNPVPRPTYYHLQLLSRYFNGFFIPSQSNIPHVRTIASTDNATISVMILNEDESAAYEYTLRFDMTGINGESPLKINLDAGINREYKGMIPYQTTLVLQFNGDGELLSKTVYSIQEARKNEPPKAMNEQGTP